MSRRKGPNLQNIPIHTPEGRRISDTVHHPSPTMEEPAPRGELNYNELERRIMDLLGLNFNELTKVLSGGHPKDAAEAKARRNAASSVGFTALYSGSKEGFLKNLRREDKT